MFYRKKFIIKHFKITLPSEEPLKESIMQILPSKKPLQNL